MAIKNIELDGTSHEIGCKAVNVDYNNTNVKSVLDSLIQHSGGLPNGKVELRILFIGNSLTQDAVAYLPLVLNEFKDYIDYKIYLWYNGGKTLSQLYTIFTNNTKAEIFSVCENAVTWTNYANTVTMADVLSTYTDFNIVSLQEYFNYKRSTGYTNEDKAAFNNIVSYISARHEGDFDVYSYWHRPLSVADGNYSDLEVAEQVFNLTKSGIEWQLGTTNGVKNTASIGIIPCGVAAYRAMAVPMLDALGSAGHASADGTHAQEGLPCLMQAWVLGQWVFDTLGVPFDEGNSMIRCTSQMITTLNVPGGNGSMIAGTEEENQAARSVASNAYREGEYIEVNALNNVVV